ncbi:glycosyl transferase family 1 [Bacillus sp. 1813sda1]|uniref:Glycosyl transferase family 1 n=2 Tax=Bacillus cereus group TaxID=86661 RepID=A0A2A7DAC2_BACAN|nr:MULTISPECIES: macrolide family glycosyltransferase [Bacillus]MCP1163955.1 glycosyl transferase family 1 [Bacillus sp. 1813sda1]MDC7975133.1 glycosyltransferase [Bacillus sp. BLCC-B18]OTW71683.1 glycosyl transferase family 1 [Bacillus thuringiensis serovar coreanensis]OTX55303.1 glycosyl transferase family 1 [Bacillus thuringiensis serovar sooncheon]OTX58640.1 glycosyl transferase family 1 [Bacillus thuringiensis serovar guiyangiensis]
MARVLFINTGSEGHINPTLQVVEELVSRGEEVVYFSIESFRERIEKTGATVRTIDEQKFIKAFLSGGRNYLPERINGLLHTADVIIPNVLEQIEGEHFDYIIHDSMFGCGRIIAQILKLPAINSCTSFAQDEKSFEQMLDHLSKSIPVKVQDKIHNDFERLTKEITVKYSVEINSPYEVFCNPAPLTIVYTIKEFQPSGEMFDETFKFVGPSISTKVKNEEFDFTTIKEKDLIYISLGTVFNEALNFYKLCIKAFENSNYTIVMSIGNKTKISDLGEIPKNFIVKNYVPQTKLLSYTKLFITHGGMNSIHEGLYNGIPLIVIPQSADQPVIAKQVENLGAGVKLSMKELTVEQLRESVEFVLNNPSYKEAALNLKESFRKSGGYKEAVDGIFTFIGQ